jgi:hypothetical protein
MGRSNAAVGVLGIGTFAQAEVTITHGRRTIRPVTFKLTLMLTLALRILPSAWPVAFVLLCFLRPAPFSLPSPLAFFGGGFSFVLPLFLAGLPFTVHTAISLVLGQLGGLCVSRMPPSVGETILLLRRAMLSFSRITSLAAPASPLLVFCVKFLKPFSSRFTI